MSFLYYVPWIGEFSRGKLGLYILSFFWFMGAWIIAVVYAVLAYRSSKTSPPLKIKYFFAISIFLISYAIVWIGIFNGYMVRV